MKAWRAMQPLAAGVAAPRPRRTYRALAAGTVTGILAAGVASFAALGSVTSAAAAGTPLRTLAEAQGRYIGTEVTGSMPSTRRSPIWPGSSSTW